jgi:UDP-glucose 4-epimerase
MKIVSRRSGDVAQVYADPSMAQQLLGWRTELDVEAMCRDAWRWQSMNRTGTKSGRQQAVSSADAVCGKSQSD